MADLRRTRPPRSGPWERFSLQRDQLDTWLVRNWPIQVKTTISSRLKDAFTKPEIVRLLRSNLSEWSRDDGWHCWRFLGAGSYGTAAVWQKTDAGGKLQDEIVVKEDRQDARSRRTDAHIIKSFSDEAEVMHTLNTHRGSNNIVHLRGYKVFLRGLADPESTSAGPDAHKDFHRFYLEYAPYGTLRNLAVRYKAFNKYLPELFLWHLFNSLATAVGELEKLPDPQLFYSHLDLKPDNIFLGYEGSETRNAIMTGGLDGESFGYPSIKLGDYGITHKMGRQGNKMIRKLYDAGTKHHQAPELMQTGSNPEGRPHQYGAQWNPPPNTLTDDLTPKADIWAVGKVIYDLFSLSQPNWYDDTRAQTREEYEGNGNRPIPDYDRVPFYWDNLHSKTPYTKELSDLIERCMHIEPTRRPNAMQLIGATWQAMNRRIAEAESELPFSVRHRKLYYSGNDINNMTIEERNCAQSLSWNEWVGLLAPGNNDPDEPPLDIYPAQMWEMQATKTGRQMAQSVFHGVVHNPDEDRRNARDFHDLILSNERRIRLGQLGIDILDPDAELTYDGTQDAAFFIREGRERKKWLRSRHGGDGGGGGNDNDEDDEDDNQGGPRGQSDPSKTRPPSEAAPKTVTNKQGVAHSGDNQVEQRYVLGQSGSRRWQVSKYVPYVPIDAHQERFENTNDGKSLIFVVDTEPNPALQPTGYTNPKVVGTRKRSADSSDDSAEAGQGQNSKRRRKDVVSVKKEPRSS